MTSIIIGAVLAAVAALLLLIDKRRPAPVPRHRRPRRESPPRPQPAPRRQATATGAVATGTAEAETEAIGTEAIGTEAIGTEATETAAIPVSPRKSADQQSRTAVAPQQPQVAAAAAPPAELFQPSPESALDSLEIAPAEQPTAPVAPEEISEPAPVIASAHDLEIAADAAATNLDSAPGVAENTGPDLEDPTRPHWSAESTQVLLLEEEADQTTNIPARGAVAALPGVLPGSSRKQRQHWAEAQGFDFEREDPYLADEWSAGPAASDAPARDVVTGALSGVEVRVMDLGKTTLIAVRRAHASREILAAVRSESRWPGHKGEISGLQGLDLIRSGLFAGPIAGEFLLGASQVGLAERLFDNRLHTALRSLPQPVFAVWAEGNWALAALPKASGPADWEATIMPLAMFADVAHALPQRRPAALWPTDLELDPSRPQVPVMVPDLPAAGPDDSSEVVAIPVPTAPPVATPKRGEAGFIGTELSGIAQPHTLGSDTVDAIAQSAPDSLQLSGVVPGPQLVRQQDGNSALFSDTPPQPVDTARDHIEPKEL